jgi:hypothetical protein
MESKQCCKCKQVKPLCDFPINNRKRDGLGTWCKPCKKEYNSFYYQATKDRFSDIRSEARKRAVARAREAVCAYLREHPCVDCGERDIVVLDFDHLDDKTFEVSAMVRNGAPWERILIEIAKCEVVCANDHRRRTAKTFGWQYRRSEAI